MSKTPFELRFKIFQKASETLNYHYKMKRKALMLKYDWKTNDARLQYFQISPSTLHLQRFLNMLLGLTISFLTGNNSEVWAPP